MGLFGGVGEAIGLNSLIRTKILGEHAENVDASELNTLVCVYVHDCVWLRDLGKPVGGTCYPTEGLSATYDRMNLMPAGCYARAH